MAKRELITWMVYRRGNGFQFFVYQPTYKTALTKALTMMGNRVHSSEVWLERVEDK